MDGSTDRSRTWPLPDRLLGLGIYVAASALGGLAFVAPLVGRNPAGGQTGLANASPWLLSIVVGLCLAALLYESGSSGLGPRAVVALGVLVASNSVLRFAETLLPGPGGFSPVFALIILSGYAYGPRFGFLMGALTLLVSGWITGGIGPWSPYQMLAAGWVGLSAGLLPRRWTAGPLQPHRRTVLGLALLGAGWGFGYGLIMTLWFWPYLDAGTLPPSGAEGSPAQRFLAFYLATSLAWDTFAALGNSLLILLTGAPLLAALWRFERRFRFQVQLPHASVPAQSSGRAILAHASGSSQPVKPSLPPPDSLHGPSGNLAFGPARGIPAPPELRPPTLGTDRPLATVGRGLQSSPPGLRAAVWLSWLVALALLLSLTRHPALLLGSLVIALATRRLLGSQRRPVWSLWRIAAMALGLPTIYNALVSHVGANVILRLPGSWPLIGGPVTVEAILYGTLTGISLLGLLVAFTSVTGGLRQRELLGVLPRGLGPVALVTAVALTYVPLVRRQAQAVREAQTVRGCEPRHWRDWTALAIPILIGALESGMALAESLVARGALRPTRPSRLHHGLVVAGLGLVLWAWIGPWPARWSSLGRAWPAVVGGGLIAIVLVALGGDGRPARLKPEGWHGRDVAAALAPWLPLALAWVDPLSRRALTYTPYPALTAPTLPPAMVLACLGLVAPHVVLAWQRWQARRSRLDAVRPLADALWMRSEP